MKFTPTPQVMLDAYDFTSPDPLPELIEDPTSPRTPLPPAGPSTARGPRLTLRRTLEWHPLGSTVGAEIEADATQVTSLPEALLPKVLIDDDVLPSVPGNYRVIERLATGGMGVIYLGEHTHLARKVAIKFLHDGAATPDAHARFFREAETASRIHHPGVAAIHDFGFAGSRPYLVMEYFEGESLAQRIERFGRLTVIETVDLAKQSARAMQAAHDAGVIHRDLKPDNIFLTQTRTRLRVKVLDFGVAKLACEAPRETVAGNLLGTPPYMSPEQCQNPSLVDERSDVYALGCVLYEMLCGRPPFDGEATDVVAAHQRQDATPITVLNPEVPTELATLLGEMLCKQPRYRPQAMAEVADRLGAIKIALADRLPLRLRLDTEDLSGTGFVQRAPESGGLGGFFRRLGRMLGG